MADARVIVAVTGGIAAYKSCEIVRRLREHRLDVRVAMTRAATHFVSPLTFAALSGERVIHDLFADSAPEEIPHVRWAETCDLFCVAPATADFLARMAHGLADDFPSTLHLAMTCPVLVAPAMEDDMLRHPSVQANLATLIARGVQVVGPDAGPLASGRSGPGRMAEPASVVAAVLRLLAGASRDRWLHGRRVLVTAGSTWESIDPMRFLANRSSGKMGYALAQEAAFLGAEVTLVSGPTCLPVPAGVRRTDVESAAQMAEAVLAAAPGADVVVMAAAVADFRPEEPAPAKIRKAGRERLRLDLVSTRDILATLGARAPRPLLVGFAAEDGDPEDGGRDKLRRKGCDLVVANPIEGPHAVPGSDDGRAVVIDRLGGRIEVGPAAKPRLAVAIWEAVRGFEDRVRAGS